MRLLDIRIDLGSKADRLGYLVERKKHHGHKTMTDTNVENQLRLTNTKLRRQLALLKERLLEKERAWEVLQDSEKYYRRLFESSRDGILILNADTGFVPIRRNGNDMKLRSNVNACGSCRWSWHNVPKMVTKSVPPLKHLW